MLGVYGVYRAPEPQPGLRADVLPVHRTASTWASWTSRGTSHAPSRSPGETAFVFGSFEAALEQGSTDDERTIDQLPGGPSDEDRRPTAARRRSASCSRASRARSRAKEVRERPDLSGASWRRSRWATPRATRTRRHDGEALRLRPEPQGGAAPLRRGDALADGARVGGRAGPEPLQRLAPAARDEAPAVERRRLRRAVRVPDGRLPPAAVARPQGRAPSSRRRRRTTSIRTASRCRART